MLLLNGDETEMTFIVQVLEEFLKACFIPSPTSKTSTGPSYCHRFPFS